MPTCFKLRAGCSSSTMRCDMPKSGAGVMCMACVECSLRSVGEWWKIDVTSLALEIHNLWVLVYLCLVFLFYFMRWQLALLLGNQHMRNLACSLDV
jgi:hypothetical protein